MGYNNNNIIDINIWEQEGILICGMHEYFGKTLKNIHYYPVKHVILVNKSLVKFEFD